ncbi:MAG: outer membrane beta-barrel protein [Deltaproteobacteria bacterium]|nr:MAG: outer membrane beta-barrel protein [Deltaproteobacteria bacterium]
MSRFFKGVIQEGVIAIAFLLVSPLIIFAQQDNFRIELLPLTQKIIADGSSRYRFTFLVLDTEYRLIQNQNIEVKAEVGTVTSSEELVPGFYQTFFTPPELAEIKPVMITTQTQIQGAVVSKAFRIKAYPDQALSISASFSPDVVIAGKMGKLGLNITVKDKAGKAVEDAKLTIESTVGKVTGIKNIGRGKYQATYTLPPEKYPQVTVVTIEAESRGLTGREMLPIPFIGQTRLEGRTKTNSKVVIRVGKKELGTVDSGQFGEFELPLTVPPGYNYATLTVTDDVGNVSKETVDLKVSKYKLMRMYINTRKLVADGNSRARVRVFVIDRFGKPMRKGKIVINASPGEVSPVREEKPGVYVTDYFTPTGLPGAERQKTVSIKVYVPGGGKELTDSGTVELWAGFLPAKMSLQITPRSLIADGRSRAAVRVELKDQTGNPLPGEPLRIAADSGDISRVNDLKNGVYTAWLTSPKKRREEGIKIKASLKMRTGRAPDDYFILEKQERIYLVTGKPALVAIEATSLTLQADGASSSRITTKITDATGNPIVGESLVITASRGKVGEVMDHEDGRYSFDYFAPKEKREQTAQITITNPSGDFTEITKILLTPRPRNFGIGPKIGYITNFGKVSGFYPGLDGSFILPWFKRVTAISLEAGYYYSSHEESVQDQGKLVTDLKIIPIFINGMYRIPAGRLKPYIGVGLGVLITNYKLSYSLQPSLTSTSWVFGFHGVGGVEMKLGPGNALVELKYNYSRLDSDLKTSSSTIEGNVGGLFAGIGYRFMF